MTSICFYCFVSFKGYYRVNYDETNWKLLAQYLQDPTQYADIAPANRAQVIDDALNLARGDRLSYKIALDITKYLEHEQDYVPWKAAMNALNFLDAMLIKGGQYHLLKVNTEIGQAKRPNHSICCLFFSFSAIFFTTHRSHVHASRFQ